MWRRPDATTRTTSRGLAPALDVSLQRHLLTVLCVLLAIALTISRASAATVLPMGLKAIHKDAQYIFHGRCISNSTEKDLSTGLTVTYTTFAVRESFKGDPGQTYVIKQVGGQLPGEPHGLVVPDVPRFEVGRDYVVFLPPPSNLGFSSPVGLGQGVFSVRPDGDSGPRVSNGRELTQVLESIPRERLPPRIAERVKSIEQKQIPSGSKARTEMPLDEFSGMLQEMSGEKLQ